MKQVVQVRLQADAAQLDVLARTYKSRTAIVCTGLGICGRLPTRKPASMPDWVRR
ncbi:MAG TPA: hypothetical protein VKA77_14795 [Mycobacterium sp.]|nr:hypothetical protein [Mycobacterium sp.]